MRVHQAPNRWAFLLAGLLAASVTSARGAGTQPESFEVLASEFESGIRPLVQQFCLECHAADIAEGDLDLEQFAKLDNVRHATRKWIKVAEMLETGEMPPKKAPKPSPEQRQRLRGWIERYLKAEAHAHAGDPGPVVLRRLSNAEYTYTVRDLTSVDLQPAREFPGDGAAGEGFTNTGNALVMSPALLTKYLDAGKLIAHHAVLLPDGLRFSNGATRRDWTNETLARIREFYRTYTNTSGGTQVNLQGIVFDTNEGGRLPLEKYLAATLAERSGLTGGSRSIEAVARERGLNSKYLKILWTSLNDHESSFLLDNVRVRWRSASLGDEAAIVSEIARWQKALWRFNSVGHIGKVGGPKVWMEPVTPMAARQEFRLRIPAPAEGNEVTLYLAADDAADGNAHDDVIWERPRLVAPGQPDLTLRDVRAACRELAEHRQRIFSSAARSLRAAEEVGTSRGRFDLAKLARQHNVDPDVLAAWLDYLGLGTGDGRVTINSHLSKTIKAASGFDFVNGWGVPETPNVVANSSDQHVRIPGNLKPHGIAMHPSPRLRVAAAWRSPIAAVVSVAGTVQHAHPECGNGVTWLLELRRGATHQRLATGTAQGPAEVKVGPVAKLAVEPGDFVSLLIGPRDGNHACDLTAVNLKLKVGEREWDLARDVAPDILAGNPHADRQGNAGVWHFYTEPDRVGEIETVIPTGSLLANWQSAASGPEKARLASEVQKLLESGPPAAKDSPDGQLYRQLASLRGPLFNAARKALGGKPTDAQADPDGPTWGLDPSLFGQQPDGQAIDALSLGVRAPSLIEVRLPADLVAGSEFVTTGTLASENGEGSVQLQVLNTKPVSSTAVTPDRPIIALDDGPARRRIDSALSQFRQLFPPALCYTKIVPVDEVITLNLFYREDDQLRRLMLDDRQAAKLDRLWDELHFISQDAIALVDVFQQLLEYASQDADPKVFEPLRKPILEHAAAFRQALIDAEPRQLDAVLDFATRAYRRPLTDAEIQGLRGLYRKLRIEEIPHVEAIRLTLARVLVAPAFLYRLEQAGPGTQSAPVSDWELASRLSYFLWSSLPDEELRNLAESGRLHNPDVLVAQTQRMLKSDKVRRLATEFACQWLHVYDFDSLDEKSDRHFPTFAALRGAMYEETIRFFTDLFQHDDSVLRIFDANHTFLNEALAQHYGIPGVDGVEWRRVDGVQAFGRGGVLAQATTLSKQSGASRTSPILRGNWVSEVLLGERIPRPPKDVPQLPDDEADSGGLTVRQMTERHTKDIRCMGCHAKIDPFGFALEGFDAIGRRRQVDVGDRPIDTHSKLQDGHEIDGLNGLRQYLLTTRRDAVLHQFCRKLLGYSLGRGVQLSDEPLLEEMKTQLESNGYRFSVAVETIVRSRQFREIRGRDLDVAEIP